MVGAEGRRAQDGVEGVAAGRLALRPEPQLAGGLRQHGEAGAPGQLGQRTGERGLGEGPGAGHEHAPLGGQEEGGDGVERRRIGHGDGSGRHDRRGCEQAVDARLQRPLLLGRREPGLERLAGPDVEVDGARIGGGDVDGLVDDPAQPP